jgi:Ca2+-binding RTX toxin-like protein
MVSALNSSSITRGDLFYTISETPQHTAWQAVYIGGTNSAETLNGTADGDNMWAGAGDDIINGSAGFDRIDGGDGWDMVSYAASTGSIVIDLQNGIFNTGDATGDRYLNVERFKLTAFNDKILGSSSGEYIYGEAGNDTISAGGGDDVVLGGAGADSIDGGLGWDVIAFDGSGPVAIDRLNPSNGTGEAAGDVYANIERFVLTAQADAFIGNNDAEMISAGNGNDVVNGGGGNDLIHGETGNDTLTGGSGSDAFFFASGFGKDVIIDFAAGSGLTDTVDLQLGTAFDTFAEVISSAAQAGSDTVITVDVNNTITLKNVNKSALVSDDFRFL